MVSKDEALKMAQEVLNLYCEQLNSTFANDALKAIEEALEQPAQKPYGWYDTHDIHNEPQSDESIPLYTHSHQVELDAEYSKGFDAGYEARFESESKSWQGLTDDEIETLVPDTGEWRCEVGVESATEFAKAIEQALKEKNHGI